VGADVAEWVLAKEPRLDLDALEAIAIGGELGDFLVREAVFDRQALGIARLGKQLPEARAVTRGDVDVLRDLVDGALDVLHPTREDLERVA
jgi:hypothetical protein